MYTKIKKKEILVDLGSNQKINDKKVLISVNKWLLPIYENAEIHNAKITKLEPLNFPLNKRKNKALTSLNLSWIRVLDDVKTKVVSSFNHIY